MTFQVTDPIPGSNDETGPGGEDDSTDVGGFFGDPVSRRDAPDQAKDADQRDEEIDLRDEDDAPSTAAAPHALVFTVAAVARRLGVAPSTLRTWARRYGLGPTSHETGTHRRYTERDLSRLQAMRRLTLAGMPAADAARAVLSSETGLTVPAPTRARRTGGGFLPPSQRDPEARPVASERVVDVRDSTLEWPAGEPIERGLFRAAAALDAGATGEIVRRAIAVHGALAAWDRLVRPLLRDIDLRWGDSPDGQAIERMATFAIDSVFRERVLRVPEPPHSRPLLLAGAPGQPTTLPLAALAAALADNDVRVRQLGPDTDAATLEAAVRRTGACAVLVHAETADDASLAATLAALPVTRPRTDIFAGGPGWSLAALPRRVRPVVTLADALTALLQSATH